MKNSSLGIEVPKEVAGTRAMYHEPPWGSALLGLRAMGMLVHCKSSISLQTMVEHIIQNDILLVEDKPSCQLNSILLLGS